MKLAPALGLLLLTLFLSTASALEIEGYVEKDVFLEGSVPEVIGCPEWMGCSLEILTKENVPDGRVQIVLYTEDPVGEPVPSTIPLREWYDVSFDQNVLLSIDNFRLGIRLPGAGGVELRAFRWDVPDGEWKPEESLYDGESDTLFITSDRPGIYSAGIEFGETGDEEAECLKETTCGEWGDCSEGEHSRECREMDPCDGGISVTVETMECEMPEETAMAPTGIFTGASEALFTWILIIFILVFIIIVLVFDLASK